MINHKIVKIKRSKKYSDRFIIYLDNKSVLRVSEDAFVLNPLKVGDLLSRSDIKELDNKMNLHKAKDAAYRLLSYRMRSIAELNKRLKEKGYNNLEIDSVISYLIELDYLNDEVFGKAFVREKVKSKKIGPVALRFEVAQHNLPIELLDKLLESIYNEYPINDLIMFHLNKKNILKNMTLSKKDANRLNNFLKRKGFYWDSIKTVYKEWGILISN
jgi:regulatory protein